MTAARSLVFSALLLLGAGTAYADNYSDTVQLFKNAGSSAAFFGHCYAYAVFPTIGEGGFIAGGGPPAYAGMPATDFAAARADAVTINRAMEELLRVAPGAGSYVSESNYFESHWQTSYWGSNYAKLAAAKRIYDPDGLFWVHHGVGGEAWSDDGFTPRTA